MSRLYYTGSDGEPNSDYGEYCEESRKKDINGGIRNGRTGGGSERREGGRMRKSSKTDTQPAEAYRIEKKPVIKSGVVCCGTCGHRVKKGYTYCNHCGQKQLKKEEFDAR